MPKSLLPVFPKPMLWLPVFQKPMLWLPLFPKPMSCLPVFPATPTDAGVFTAFVAFAGAGPLLRVPALVDVVLWLLLPVEDVPAAVCVVSALATADPLASTAPTPRLTTPAPSQPNA